MVIRSSLYFRKGPQQPVWRIDSSVDSREQGGNEEEVREDLSRQQQFGRRRTWDRCVVEKEKSQHHPMAASSLLSWL